MIIKINSSLKKYSVYVNNGKFKNKDSYFYIIDDYFKNKLNNYDINKKNTVFIKASENSKSYNQISKTISRLINLNINKESTIVCIGGGITQDICSFISMILFRGISWIFIPTTLLSQSDSCIGSKIAINFFKIKNLIGGYYPPNRIYLDTNFIKTLSKKEIYSGLGEMSHYYYLSNKQKFNFFQKSLFEYLNDGNLNYQDLIYNSLLIKKKFIEKDEFEKKERIFLNFGHSFGHAIESINNFKIPHGIAVAKGMHIANYLSLKLKYMTKQNYEKLQLPLEALYGKFNKINLDLDLIIKALLKDKKTINGKIRLILIEDIGKPFIKEFKRNSILKKYLKNYLINH